jgi:glycosyltransferase involved in cell wall biosynthesis
MALVSVIVPCYNEEKTIALLLEALYKQTYPRAELEVLISDGQSSDGTRQVVANFHHAHPDLCVRIIDNPARSIPAALNRAITASSGAYIVRLDAHSMPYPDYVERCVSALQSGRGDNVGGVWEIHPANPGWQARSIAMAASHPLGVGDAHYRFTGQAQAVDTVPFGAYHRTLVEKIGQYDETLLTNEDYEFNTRVRQSGGVVWLDPAIRTVYFARPDLAALSRQYWRYGYWKARMLRRYPEAIRWRQALPPVFVLSILALLVLAVWLPLVRWIFVLELASYSMLLLALGLRLGIKHLDIALVLGVPLAIATMHLTWGGAFLWSLVRK